MLIQQWHKKYLKYLKSLICLQAQSSPTFTHMYSFLLVNQSDEIEPGSQRGKPDMIEDQEKERLGNRKQYYDCY